MTANTMYRQSGTQYHLTNDQNLKITDNLPAGVYSVKYADMIGFYLERLMDNFSMPSKLYGSIDKRTNRIMDTFNRVDNSIGVLMSGNQGSGKTLLSKNVCNKFIENGVPTLLVSESFFSDEFKTFINSISQPTCVVFDEFEKVYSVTEHQQALLSLFDGVYQNKKLWLMTVNDDHGLIPQFNNRFSRIRYRFDYIGLEREVVEEFCLDNLDNKQHIESIIGVTTFYGDQFNFDMLQGIVTELNMYPDDNLHDVIDILNFRIDTSKRYKCVSLSKDGIELKLFSEEIYNNIINRSFSVCCFKNSDDEENDNESYVHLDNSCLTQYNNKTGKLVFERDGILAVFDEVENTHFHLKNIF